MGFSHTDTLNFLIFQLSYDHFPKPAPSKELIALDSLWDSARIHAAITVDVVQRLFSMFPAGAAGCGLLLLRICAAGMLARNCILDATVSIPMWEIAGVIILAGAFCLGAFTPVGCCISALLQIFVLLRAYQPNPLHFVFSFCVTAALFLLGPGAFSLDSRLFGRRLIVHSNSK
jgi:hypothetical protein